YYPDPKNTIWHGSSSSDPQAATAKRADDLNQSRGEIWVAGNAMSSSRLGTDHLQVPKAGDIASARAVARLSHASQDAVSGTFFGAGGTKSSGTGVGEVDYLDMNGSGFPSVVANGRI